MLLDPFEKQLHRPTSLVELAGQNYWSERRTIGSAPDHESGCVATQPRNVFWTTCFSTGWFGRISSLATCRPLWIQRRKSLRDTCCARQSWRPLGAADQPCKIQMPAIHHGERTRLDWNLVEHFNLWKRGFRDGGPNGQIAFKRDQRVQLHGAGA